MMKRLLAACATAATLVGPALAADPSGEWLVEDGDARIKIATCASRLWGVVSWDKVPARTDRNNPDASKRDRPIIGLPVLLGMKAAGPDRWDGQIYNAKDGKTYTANIKLQAPDHLHVEGCVMGFLCAGQDWTRVQSHDADKPQQHSRGRTPGASGSAPDVCSRVSEL